MIFRVLAEAPPAYQHLVLERLHYLKQPATVIYSCSQKTRTSIKRTLRKQGHLLSSISWKWAATAHPVQFKKMVLMHFFKYILKATKRFPINLQSIYNVGLHELNYSKSDLSWILSKTQLELDFLHEKSSHSKSSTLPLFDASAWKNHLSASEQKITWLSSDTPIWTKACYASVILISVLGFGLGLQYTWQSTQKLKPTNLDQDIVTEISTEATPPFESNLIVPTNTSFSMDRMQSFEWMLYNHLNKRWRKTITSMINYIIVTSHSETQTQPSPKVLYRHALDLARQYNVQVVRKPENLKLDQFLPYTTLMIGSQRHINTVVSALQRRGRIKIIPYETEWRQLPSDHSRILLHFK